MRFFVGSIEVDATTGVAWVDGNVLPLGKKVVATLAALYARAGEVVAKDALLRAAWADVAVDDSSLWQNIHVLRGALARHAPAATIETVKGRGYRLTLGAAAPTFVEQPVVPVTEHLPLPAAEQSSATDAARDAQCVPHSEPARWFWPAAAALLCAVAINAMFEHHPPARRTIILITTNAAGKLPPLPPLPSTE